MSKERIVTESVASGDCVCKGSRQQQQEDLKSLLDMVVVACLLKAGRQSD